ncbi:MAG: hypothetical protein HOV80_14840 [Polyangiaceae bacterium]|nr:hypothetical protein [Polyangiaceae bacterium]
MSSEPNDQQTEETSPPSEQPKPKKRDIEMELRRRARLAQLTANRRYRRGWR